MMDVSQFIDSQEMREYLKAVQLSERTCEELVCGSPKPLAKELAWLEQQGSACADEARRALDGLKLKPGEFLWLTAVWYDPDFHGWESSTEGCMTARRCYASFEDAFEGWDKETKTQEIQKWWMDPAGSYINTMLDAHKNVYFAAKGSYSEGISYYNDIWINMASALPTPFHRGDIIQVMGQHELFVLDHMANWTAEESAANGIAPGAVFPEPEYYYNVGEEQEPICYGYSLSGESNMDFDYIGRSDILSFERYTGELEGYQRILSAISAQLKSEIDLGEFLKRGLRFLGQA